MCNNAGSLAEIHYIFFIALWKVNVEIGSRMGKVFGETYTREQERAI